jgi:hypothetical protein
MPAGIHTIQEKKEDHTIDPKVTFFINYKKRLWNPSNPYKGGFQERSQYLGGRRNIPLSTLISYYWLKILISTIRVNSWGGYLCSCLMTLLLMTIRVRSGLQKKSMRMARKNWCLGRVGIRMRGEELIIDHCGLTIITHRPNFFRWSGWRMGAQVNCSVFFSVLMLRILENMLRELLTLLKREVTVMPSSDIIITLIICLNKICVS